MIKINKASSKDLLGVAKLILNNFVKEINKNIPELESEKDANQKKFLLFYLGMYKKRTPHCVFVAKDGDEIVRLMHYGDRILQYKKRTLYIINISQEFMRIDNIIK